MSRVEQLQEGEIIDGKFRVISTLGRGGFAVVYKALKLGTQMEVALKLLLPDALEKREELARFRREMNVIAKLRHPNTVQFIDSGQLHTGEPYMALEFVDGEELTDVLAREGRLAPREALRLMSQIIDALCAAHDIGAVHRDLKPQNIMVTSTGARRNALVLDFGIAGIVEDARQDDYLTLTQKGLVLGTPAYMAPEQLKGRPCPQSDIYAWGLIFAECLTGDKIMVADTLAELVANQLAPTPVPIPPHLAGSAFGSILARATAKDLSQRYPDARAAFHDINELENSGRPLELGAPPEPATMMMSPEQLGLGGSTGRGPASSPHTGQGGWGAEPASQGNNTQPMNRASVELDAPSGYKSGAGRASQMMPRRDSGADRPSGPTPGRISREPTRAVPPQPPPPEPVELPKSGSPWGIVAVVVLLLGAGGAAFFLSRGDDDAESGDAGSESSSEVEPQGLGGASTTAADTPDVLESSAPVEEGNPTAIEVVRYEHGKGYRIQGTRGASEMIYLEGGRLTAGLDPAGHKALEDVCETLYGEEFAKYVCDDDELLALELAEPVVEVEVPSFFIDRYEVSEEDYAACVKAGGCSEAKRSECQTLSPKKGVYSSKEDAIPTAPELPVTCVHRTEAAAYCAWADKRLVSEAEWEFAAAGREGRLFPWGEDAGKGDVPVNGADRSMMAVYGWKSRDEALFLRDFDDAHPRLAPVTSMRDGATPEAIHHLAGNAREWVADPLASYPKGEKLSRKFKGHGVTRGGSFTDIGPWLSTRYRFPLPTDARRDDLGFRCARSSVDDIGEGTALPSAAVEDTGKPDKPKRADRPKPDKPKKNSVPSRSAEPVVKLGKMRVREIDERLAGRIIRRKLGSIGRCYQVGLRKDPDLEGRIALVLSLDASGRVERAEAKNSASLDTVTSCITKTAKRWRFPASTSGSAATIIAELELLTRG